MNTAAFLADLRCSGEMKMKREKENEQQDYRANKAADVVRFPHPGNEHGSEPSRSLPACQENAQKLGRWTALRFHPTCRCL